MTRERAGFSPAISSCARVIRASVCGMCHALHSQKAGFVVLNAAAARLPKILWTLRP